METDELQERMLAARSVCEMFDVKLPTVREWVARGKLLCVRLYGSRTVRFRLSDLQRIIETGSADGN